MPATHSTLHGEIGKLSLFISIPQLVTAPIVVAVTKLLYAHINSSYEISEVLDFPVKTSYRLRMI